MAILIWYNVQRNISSLFFFITKHILVPLYQPNYTIFLWVILSTSPPLDLTLLKVDF